MKKYYILLCLTAVLANRANSQSYETKFKADMCVCFEEEIVNARRVNMALETCFRQELTSYAMLIDAEIVEENVSLKYQKGQIARRDLFKKFKYEMVYSCDFYFNTLVSERQKGMDKKRLKTDSTRLKDLNQRVAMSPNFSAYSERAKTQLYLGNLKEAELDIRESMRLHPLSTHEIYTLKEKLILAVILEEQQQYKEAIVIYNEAYEFSKDVDAAVLSAIANRKAGGIKTVFKKTDKTMTSNKLKNPSTGKPEKKTEKSGLRKLFDLDKKKKDN